MNKHLVFLFIFLAGINSATGADGIVVVANIKNKTMQLTRQEVRNLFMGGAIPYQLKAIALPANNRTRVFFNTKVVGLTESRVQSYWAQMRFTGRKKPPKEIKSEKLLLGYLIDNEGAVGYLPASTPLPASLSVLYTSN
ncbi:hypothetical protein RS130_05820 [Paraglaciecola aquimarina]|uniref:Phosphate ABC transporter substrate-binding protein n=1 Tax=Paraglaciecola aquimarina TaxID=1235557 RepID=A0ABU3SU47_9ALTE|nr:hypothetical protein [Paraglaciecola aquimarina]MDU0353508.1 hypothetical protein [Paraglaciecola aquimarina]